MDDNNFPWTSAPTPGTDGMNPTQTLALAGPQPLALRLSDQQLFLQQILSIVAASISLTIGLPSLVWFYRMKRSFRLRLIMILMVCNAFKAAWYCISPIILIALKPHLDPSKICPPVGFFFAAGIESADFAILAVAVHVALCIFRPRTSLGESGLYPYRGFVYFGIPGVSILLAALGFTQPGSVYVDVGSWCYYPIRPFWYRLALAWIPRYLILLGLLVLNFSVFYCVRRNFRRFGFHVSGSMDTTTGRIALDAAGLGTDDKMPPISPTTAPDPRHTFQDEVSLTKSQPTKDSPQWENYTFGSTVPLPHVPDDMRRKSVAPIEESSDWRDASLALSQTTSEREHSLMEALHYGPNWCPEDDPHAETPVNERDDSDPSVPTLPVGSISQDAATVALQVLRARHRAIMHQMRYLFIYPIAYFLLWLPSFVQQCLQYSDTYARNPNFGLTCVTAVLVASQGAVIAVLFMWREKPWRYHYGQQLAVPAIERSNFWSLLLCCFFQRKPPTRRRGPCWCNGDHELDHDEPPRPAVPILETPCGNVNVVAPALPSSSATQLSFSSRIKSALLCHESGPGKSSGEMRAEAEAARVRRLHERRANAAAKHRAVAADRLAAAVAAAAANNSSRPGLGMTSNSGRKISTFRRPTGFNFFRDGTGHRERNWWEVEGWRRKDSVLLGTDGPVPSLALSPLTRDNPLTRDLTAHISPISSARGVQDEAISPLGQPPSRWPTNPLARQFTQPESLTMSPSQGLSSGIATFGSPGPSPRSASTSSHFPGLVTRSSRSAEHATVMDASYEDSSCTDSAPSQSAPQKNSSSQPPLEVSGGTPGTPQSPGVGGPGSGLKSSSRPSSGALDQLSNVSSPSVGTVSKSANPSLSTIDPSISPGFSPGLSPSQSPGHSPNLSMGHSSSLSRGSMRMGNRTGARPSMMLLAPHSIKSSGSGSASVSGAGAGAGTGLAGGAGLGSGAGSLRVPSAPHSPRTPTMPTLAE